jgi:RNA polymerase sigma factor (sigma-70 family)
MEDFELLREYAEQRSERAFTALVERHIHFVYSTALRLVNSQLAEDVTQMAFIKLARKAAALREGTVVTGWLYRTTQYLAQTAQRSDWRRRKRESLAMQFTELNTDGASVWNEVAPLLEQAVAQLQKADQDAVLLRFFAGKSLREVGGALGISDDAAQKRVNRALEKMRDYFARHGVVASTAVIAPAIAAHAVQMAPGALASAVTASLAGAAGDLSAAVTLNTLKAMALAKLKAAAAGWVAAATLLFVGIAVVVKMSPEANQAGAAAIAPLPPAWVLRGTVRTPEGKPLAGALVRVATPQSHVRLYQTTNSLTPTNVVRGASNRLAKAPPQPVWTNTAADGGFVIGLPARPKDGMAAVVATSDAGYALVTADELSSNPDLMVELWARIEGVLRVGHAVGSNQPVELGIWGSSALYEWNLVSHSASTKTDADGRFVFPRVAPVDVWLTRRVMVRSNDWRQSGHHYVKVSPGDKIVVQLGGTGRPVTGRVSWDSTNKLVFHGSMWAKQHHGMRPPRDWPQMSVEERRQYELAWRESPEGGLFKEEVRNYEFAVSPGGAFWVEDVSPGSYRLQVRSAPATPEDKQPAAVAEIDLDVGPTPAGHKDEPLDIGMLSPSRP